MRVAFLICSRDEDPALLQATIDGLWSTVEHPDILVVDDGSKNPVKCQGAAVLRNPEALGPAGAACLGMQARSEHQVVCLLDSHLSFSPGWLESLLTHLRPGRLLCSAWWDYERLNCKGYGADLGWNERSGTFSLKPRIRRPRLRAPRVSAPIGACYVFFRSECLQLGGLNPLFRGWGLLEEDLALRYWAAGWEVRCVREAVVGHLSRTTPPRWPLSRQNYLFNHLVLTQSVFEPKVRKALRGFFEPAATRLERELLAVGLLEWRERVQRARRLDDKTLLTRLGKGLPVTPGGRFRGQFQPKGWAVAEERASLIEEPGALLPDGYSLKARPDNTFELSSGTSFSAYFLDPAEAIEYALEHQDRELQGTGDFLVCSGSVVQWNEAVVLLPGLRSWGRRVLAHWLAKHGGRVLAEDSIVIDKLGQVRPAHKKPDIIAFVRLRPSSKTELEVLSLAFGIAALLGQAVAPAAEPWIFHQILAREFSGVTFLAGARDTLTERTRIRIVEYLAGRAGPLAQPVPHRKRPSAPLGAPGQRSRKF